ncbi:hypothetical protein [Hyalangium sp.]|uniref:hypothetical protein n=1 Tax=Hyalangium sp. TaxID=2028555 RepID=UPI002D67D273|nr:hypothetical protein [Hyalangium sp.]HYH97838.1 hypothetical protein [Hyalangium sp.]
MKTMRLDNVKVQGGQRDSLEMPPVCVCGAGSTGPSHPASPTSVPTCHECGGSLPQAEASTSQERRHLQDFLSAFV